MAYLALYRTFRPTTLSEVVRQDHIVTILKNQIETGKIGHAYLFCGPRGTGKTSVAKIFAAAINCENPVDGSPCGKCAACRALKDPSNLDISEIDAASNNGVDEMRDLREKVQYPPVAGKYKVYIVDEVHMLSTGAFNALLKTLEEPPAHAVFILATTESQKIPATILSRCMRFDFKLIPQADLENLLCGVLDKIGKPYEQDAVAAIARAGAGSARDTLSLADTCVSYSKGTLTLSDVTAVLGSAEFTGVSELCKNMLTGNAGAAFSAAEKILAEGKSIGTLVKDVMNFLNGCAIVKTCRDAQKILALSKDAFNLVASVAGEVDGHAILRASEIFAKVENDLKYSVSPKIVFETAVLKTSMPKEDYDIEALLARIELLERKIDSGAISTAPRACTQESAPVQELPPQKPKKTAAERKAEEFYGEAQPFPDDEPPMEEGGFEPVPAIQPTPAPTPAPAAPAPIKEIKLASTSANSLFGGFLRALRKTCKNGVLFTLCEDLEPSLDGNKFILSTTSDNICSRLNKEDYLALIADALKAVGVTDFEVQKKGKQKDEYKSAIDELKQAFSGVKIDEQ